MTKAVTNGPISPTAAAGRRYGRSHATRVPKSTAPAEGFSSANRRKTATAGNAGVRKEPAAHVKTARILQGNVLERSLLACRELP